MTALRKMRRLSGLTQFLVSQRSGVNRMRLSLAETGQLRLRPEEEVAVRRVLRQAIEKQSAQLRGVMENAESIRAGGAV